MGEPLGLWTCGKLSAALRVSHMSTAPTTASGYRRWRRLAVADLTSYGIGGMMSPVYCGLAVLTSEGWGSTSFWPIRVPKNGANLRSPRERDAVQSSHTQLTKHRPKRASIITLALALLLGGAALTGCTPGTNAGVQPTAPAALATLPQSRLVTPAELQERFGVQVALAAVTSGGGLIDLRFRVTDAAKAAAVFQAGNLPTVIVPDRGITISPPTPPDPGPLTDGQVTFLLYPNAGGAVRGQPDRPGLGSDRARDPGRAVTETHPQSMKRRIPP